MFARASASARSMQGRADIDMELSPRTWRL
jgi:hypothetical protein